MAIGQIAGSLINGMFNSWSNRKAAQQQYNLGLAQLRQQALDRDQAERFSRYEREWAASTFGLQRADLEKHRTEDYQRDQANFNRSFSEAQRQYDTSLAEARRQFDRQQFNAIQDKVADARAAGLHPLAALGMASGGGSAIPTGSVPQAGSAGPSGAAQAFPIQGQSPYGSSTADGLATLAQASAARTLAASSGQAALAEGITQLGFELWNRKAQAAKDAAAIAEVNSRTRANNAQADLYLSQIQRAAQEANYKRSPVDFASDAVPRSAAPPSASDAPKKNVRDPGEGGRWKFPFFGWDMPNPSSTLQEWIEGQFGGGVAEPLGALRFADSVATKIHEEAYEASENIKKAWKKRKAKETARKAMERKAKKRAYSPISDYNLGP